MTRRSLLLLVAAVLAVPWLARATVTAAEFAPTHAIVDGVRYPVA